MFIFGHGVGLPTRMRFISLAPEFRPQSKASGNIRTDVGAVTPDMINAVIERWRSASICHRASSEELLDYGALEAPLQPASAAAPLGPPTVPQAPVSPPVSPRDEALRASLLKKPLDASLGGNLPNTPSFSKYR